MAKTMITVEIDSITKEVIIGCETDNEEGNTDLTPSDFTFYTTQAILDTAMEMHNNNLCECIVDAHIDAMHIMMDKHNKAMRKKEKKAKIKTKKIQDANVNVVKQILGNPPIHGKSSDHE